MSLFNYFSICETLLYLICPLKEKGVTSKVRLLLIIPSYEHSPKPLFFVASKLV